MHPDLTHLMAAATALHAGHADLRDFVAMGNDLVDGDYQRQDHPAQAVMCAQHWPDARPGDPLELATALRDAFVAAAPLAQWRYTYEGSKIDPDFIERFGCYCMIGSGGFWSSAQLSGYVVYMPPGLHYPWHQHPAEEMYVMLAGSAEFHLQGQPPQTLTAGQAVFHPSGVPHATTTHDDPMMAYVTWRNHLDIVPEWTDPGLR